MASGGPPRRSGFPGYGPGLGRFVRPGATAWFALAGPWGTDASRRPGRPRQAGPQKGDTGIASRGPEPRRWHPSCRPLADAYQPSHAGRLGCSWCLPLGSWPPRRSCHDRHDRLARSLPE